VLTPFQKDKSLVLDGWIVELFIGFYELLEEDLLQVLEESMVSSKVIGDFNSTFLALIPKNDNPSYFDDSLSLSLSLSLSIYIYIYIYIYIS